MGTSGVRAANMGQTVRPGQERNKWTGLDLSQDMRLSELKLQQPWEKEEADCTAGG